MAPEVRLERLRPPEIDEALARAPVAWVPLGAARVSQPAPADRHGRPDRPRYARGGGRAPRWCRTAVVVPDDGHPGPALVVPLRPGARRRGPAPDAAPAPRAGCPAGGRPHRAPAARPDRPHQARLRGGRGRGGRVGRRLRTMGLCYLELNAALGTGLGTDWPVTVDHGATMETSWVAALAPDLVATDRLPDDPAATIVGVYGPNPRSTADAATGAEQIAAAAALLAERAGAVLRGEDYDPHADLRGFVGRYWPEPLSSWPAGPGRPATRMAVRPSSSRTRPRSRAMSRVSRCGWMGGRCRPMPCPSSTPHPGRPASRSRRPILGRSAASTCAASRRPRSACPDGSPPARTSWRWCWAWPG